MSSFLISLLFRPYSSIKDPLINCDIALAVYHYIVLPIKRTTKIYLIMASSI